MSIGKDGHVYRDKPLPEPTPEFLEALDEYFEREDVRLAQLGRELMNRWTDARKYNDGFAAMGHLDGDSYKFILDSEYEVTVKKI